MKKFVVVLSLLSNPAGATEVHFCATTCFWDFTRYHLEIVTGLGTTQDQAVRQMKEKCGSAQRPFDKMMNYQLATPTFKKAGFGEKKTGPLEPRKRSNNELLLRKHACSSMRL